MQHRRGHAVQVLVGRQRGVDDVLPPPEPDQDVQLHRHEALEPVRHRRDLHAEQLLRDQSGQAVGGVERGLRLAEKHRAVDLEVVIVRPVQGVEVDRSPLGDEPLVGGDRGCIAGHHAAIVAAQYVEVRGHVPQVPGVGDEVAKQVGGEERILWPRRHLHQVDVHVQDARMSAALGAGKRLSRTIFASAVAAPSAGSPVTMFHSAHGVRFISASANSTATSMSPG